MGYTAWSTKQISQMSRAKNKILIGLQIFLPKSHIYFQNNNNIKNSFMEIFW